MWRYSSSLDDLAVRFARALWDLVDETGQPQPLRAIGERAGLGPDQYVVACAIAVVRGLVIKLELDRPDPGDGHYLEYSPAGER
jgi:hypothetical protein